MQTALNASKQRTVLRELKLNLGARNLEFGMPIEIQMCIPFRSVEPRKVVYGYFLWAGVHMDDHHVRYVRVEDVERLMAESVDPRSLIKTVSHGDVRRISEVQAPEEERQFVLGAFKTIVDEAVAALCRDCLKRLRGANPRA